MAEFIDNWKTQIRKGYLELCILLLTQKHGRIYGFDLLDKLANLHLPLKEGTLYPILNRMTSDGLLQSTWETEQLKGAPRKFYSLTPSGKQHLARMTEEFEQMISIFQNTQT
ncbi:MAG: PadR family transcriptional regulator [Bdellovibrionales bacterium]|nr:PadR family transcriptional regulator [Bdellovibrionales bacterium]